ncbi:MAG: penicillin-binding protein 1C [Deltaproteobacteria bacterium]|nr:penicillin-binding protein 1C [Deltaproteobacteria bacterium]
MKDILPKSRVLRALFYLAASFAAAAACLFYAARFDSKDLAYPDNLVFVDRNGALLRFVPDGRGERHIWVSLDKMPQVVKDAFIAAEDQRFYLHPGFDLAAITRALRDNMNAGRIVSGASTITQQTVRLVYSRQGSRKRTYWGKFIEILRAARMELALSKAGILEQYLNRVPMGNNIVGVELGARTYFGKSVKDLDAGEAALLASLPKAPGRLNPYAGDPARLLARRDWVLSQMALDGSLSREAYDAAAPSKPFFQSAGFPSEAPHLVDYLIARNEPGAARVRTTVDMEIQKAVERIVSSHGARLSYQGARQAAVLVIYNPTMEALASVGSVSYGGANKGFNNGTLALRSAGSTLKPFLYALALDSGFNVTWSIRDTLKKYRTPKGDYAPVNFDRMQYGPVTMRTALGNSLNISAVRMLEAVGQERYFSLLSGLGLINDPSKSADYYGLGLVVGNPEVRLEELVSAYAMLANGGVFRPLSYTIDPGRSQGADAGNRVFSREAAFIISDILSDPSARFITFGNAEAMRYPFKVSMKTGTSAGYRDAWAIGYTPEYTVGIWVGNFEGDPTFNSSGAKGAAPILNDVFRLLYRDKAPSLIETPDNVVSAKVCGISGGKPGRFCRNIAREFFIKGNEPKDVCAFHTDGERLHKLPSAYASWVYDKKRAGAAGSYRIKGLSDGLDDEDGGKPLEEAGYRVDAKGHYSIGARQARPQAGLQGLDYAVSITYPLNNDRFIVEKGRSDQVIRLEAVTEKSVQYVSWFIDGELYKKAAPPYDVYWKPEKGWHVISVSTPEDLGDSIRLRVE